MFYVIAKLWIWCLFILHVTHHAFIPLHYFWLFLLLFIWHWWMCFACACLCCQVHSLFLALFPPLPQVLQGTTMQQLQQVQVAQSQATPITVNTSNPWKWPLFIPKKSHFKAQKSFYLWLFSWQLNKNSLSRHNTSAKISLFGYYIMYYTWNNPASRSRGYFFNFFFSSNFLDTDIYYIFIINLLVSVFLQSPFTDFNHI